MPVTASDTPEVMANFPKIRVRGLKKSFGALAVLTDVDLDIAAGDNLVLLGASGSGKTVLLKCILGLVEPDAGSILVDGHEIVGLDQAERERSPYKLGVLFQNGALFDSLPIWQNIVFDPTNADGAGLDEVAKAVAIRELASVGLGPEVAELFPAELSGGMQKRAALARAFCHDPEILLLDSPTAGLDPIMTTIIDELILALLAHLHATAMTITHDVASARRIGNRIAMLSDGRIVWEGATEDAEHSGNAWLEEFIRRGGWDAAAS
jgi:phospholipid/cholesterol/gamma-HCH transport system ATP-binding protein